MEPFVECLFVVQSGGEFEKKCFVQGAPFSALKKSVQERWPFYHDPGEYEVYEYIFVGVSSVCYELLAEL